MAGAVEFDCAKCGKHNRIDNMHTPSVQACVIGYYCIHCGTMSDIKPGQEPAPPAPLPPPPAGAAQGELV